MSKTTITRCNEEEAKPAMSESPLAVTLTYFIIYSISCDDNLVNLASVSQSQSSLCFVVHGINLIFCITSLYSQQEERIHGFF